jgi:PAS domain S-box-containing protein
MSHRLRIGIWLGVAVLLLLCGAFVGLTIRQDRADDLTHAGEMSRIIVTSLEDQATATLRDVTNGLFSAAQAVRSDGGLPLMTEDGLRHMLRRDFTDSAVLADIVVLDTQGKVVTHTAAGNLRSDTYPNGAGITYFRANPQDPRAFISAPLIGPTYRRWLLPVSVPLRSYEGELEGMVTALVDLDYFQHFYAGLGERRAWQYTITDMQGHIVTHYPLTDSVAPAAPATRFFPDAPARLRPRVSESFFAPNPLTGRPFLYAARPFSNSQLVMYVGVDVEQQLAQWRTRAAEKLAMLLLLAAVLAIATVLLIRVLKKSSHDSQLVTAVFRAAGDSIFISSSGRILACNPAAVRTYGARDASELIGHAPREFWAERQPDGTLSIEKGALMYKHAQDPDGYSFEWLVQRISGGTFLSEVHLTSFVVDGVTYYLGITRDITERKQAENQIRLLNFDLESRVTSRTEQLASAKRELEVANEELRAFSYTVAHDIRAPVRHVLGFADMAMSSEMPEDVRACLERIVGASTRMNEMIDSLLALGRVGQKALADTEFDMSALAQSIVAGLRERAPQRRAEVRIEPGLIVRADPTLMHLVLENLLSNAWKFTGKKDEAKIEFGCGMDDAGYHFYVRDNGAGFDTRYATRMFEPFSRMHQRDEFEGTGVGLATVRRILARHGGTIRAESAVGEGATFYFSLGARDARVYRQAAAAL